MIRPARRLKAFISSTFIAHQMQYSTVQLPIEIFEVLKGYTKGNFMTRNARFREAVCQSFNLRWISVGGTGNCLFESVRLGLLDAIQVVTTAADIRAHVVGFLRGCLNSEEPLSERCVVEMQDEVSEALVCSSYKRLNGVLINGFTPSTIVEYLDASEIEGVWPQGLHWLRAISFLHDVRIGVVIFNQPIVRYIGSGEKTIFLYKSDAGTHYDPLLSSNGLVLTAAEDQANGMPSDDDKDFRVHSPQILLSDAADCDDNRVHGPQTLLSDAADDNRVHSPQSLLSDAADCDDNRVHGPQSLLSDAADIHHYIRVHGIQSRVHARTRRTCRMQMQPLPAEEEADDSDDVDAADAADAADDIRVHGTHAQQSQDMGLQGRPKRTCRMPCQPPEPKKRASHNVSSDGDTDDIPLLSKKSRPKPNQRIMEKDAHLLLSTGSTFIAASCAEAKDWLREQLSHIHTGGHIFVRNSYDRYIYICCKFCSMSCAAGSKKNATHSWHITSVSPNALVPCCRMSSLSSTSDAATMPSTIIPSVKNPVENFPEGPEVECIVCMEKLRRVTLCSQGHAWCNACFAYNVECQCSPTDEHLGMEKFLERRGVVCTGCPPVPHGKPWTFNMETLRVW
jgi:hypothetical protein